MALDASLDDSHRRVENGAGKMKRLRSNSSLLEDSAYGLQKKHLWE